MIRKALGTIIGGVLALVLIGFVPQARAGARDQLTRLNFNQPVQLPQNVILPAGTYWFQVLGPLSGGETVQIFNADRTQLLGSFLTITNERPLNMAGETQLTLGRIPNQPPLLIGWIYPGQTQGHEFVYSPDKENRLAEAGSLATVQIPNGATVTVG